METWWDAIPPEQQSDVQRFLVDAATAYPSAPERAMADCMHKFQMTADQYIYLTGIQVALTTVITYVVVVVVVVAVVVVAVAVVMYILLQPRWRTPVEEDVAQAGSQLEDVQKQTRDAPT
jgi:uncharacterized membrane protein